MNLSDLIAPAATGLLTGIGVFFSLDKRQAVAETRLTTQLVAIEKTLVEIKTEHMRSAADQGARLGELKDEVGTLKDFKARMEGREAERDLSGVVRR